MKTEQETRKCKQCQEDYFPTYYEVMGMSILRGEGYCPDCATQNQKQLDQQEEIARLARIATTRKQRRNSCGIPGKYMNQDFSTFEKGWQDKAFKECWDYAESFPIGNRPKGYPGLYLWSANTWGTGKTHLSCAIIHRILDRWNGQMEMSQWGFEIESRCPRPVFVSEPDLFRKIQATYSYNYEEKQIGESEGKIMRNIIDADLLVLDDVGKEKRMNPDFIQRTLFAIIDGRNKQGLPLVLTANLAPNDLKDHLDSASFDRVWELTQGKGIRMDGRSFRREGK